MHGQKFHFGGRHVNLRGCGIQKTLIESKQKVEDVIPSSLPSEALKRLESLRPKSLTSVKRPNIKFSL
jgi:hypothetical protein